MDYQDEARRTQVVIFAGGMGKRLGTRKQKALVQLNGKTLLDICIDSFTIFGFRKFVFLLGYRYDEVISHLEKRKDIDYDFSVDREANYGRLNSLRDALMSSKINRDLRSYVAYPDDIILDKRVIIKSLLRHVSLVKKKSIYASVILTNGIELPYGVAYIGKDGTVKEFVEKPFLKLMTSVGFFILEPAAYEIILRLKGGSIERNLFPYLAKKGKMSSIQINYKKWLPVNTRKDLENAERIMLKSIVSSPRM